MNAALFPRRTFLSSTAALGLAAALPRLARAQSLQKVNLIGPLALTGLVIEDLAVSQGFFKEQGLEPNYMNVSDGVKAIAALVGGSAEMCIYSGFGPVLAAIEKGAHLKLVAGALLLSNNAIITKRADIHKVADLAGKTIGVGALGAYLHQITVALLKKKGVDTSKVRFVNVGSDADVFKAVVAGTIDAGPVDFDVYDNISKYGVHGLSDGEMWAQLPNYTVQASFATDEAIAANRPFLVGTLAALAKTYRFIESPESRDVWVKTYLKLSGRPDTDEAISWWNFLAKYKPYALDLMLNQERVDFIQNLNVQYGVQKKALPYAQVADMSLAQEAVKRIG